MKTFLIKILFSFIALLLILYSLSYLYTFGLNHNLNIKAVYVQNNKVDADIIFHGPCEPLWIVSPKIIDNITKVKSYNLALSHSDFADNYLHLYFYLKNNKAPKFLFLYATPESMDLNYNTFNTYRFTASIGDSLVDEVLKECDYDYFKWTKIPFMKYAYYNSKINFDVIQGTKHFFTNRKTPYFIDGYEPPFQVKWDNHLEKFIQLYPKGYYFKWNNKREKYLRKCIELAQKNDIQVYLYESPVLKESTLYQPNRDEFTYKIKKIANEYKINYLQFQGMKISESRDYFMSTLNLNLQGSAIFNDSLGKYIKQEILDKN